MFIFLNISNKMLIQKTLEITKTIRHERVCGKVKKERPRNSWDKELKEIGWPRTEKNGLLRLPDPSLIIEGKGM